jgi:hypothetical protein
MFRMIFVCKQHLIAFRKNNWVFGISKFMFPLEQIIELLSWRITWDTRQCAKWVWKNLVIEDKLATISTSKTFVNYKLDGRSKVCVEYIMPLNLDCQLGLWLTSRRILNGLCVKQPWHW